MNHTWGKPETREKFHFVNCLLAERDQTEDSERTFGVTFWPLPGPLSRCLIGGRMDLTAPTCSPAEAGALASGLCWVSDDGSQLRKEMTLVIPPAQGRCLPIRPLPPARPEQEPHSPSMVRLQLRMAGGRGLNKKAIAPGARNHQLSCSQVNHASGAQQRPECTSLSQKSVTLSMTEWPEGKFKCAAQICFSLVLSAPKVF